MSKCKLSIPSEDEVQNCTLIETVVNPDTLNKIIGPTTQKYLPRAKDEWGMKDMA